MPRLTDEKWEELESKYHTGQYTKLELSKLFNVSRAAINKRIGDVEPKFKDMVTSISAYKSELSKESYTQVTAVETEIEKRTKHILLFETSALKNQQKANKLLEEADKLNDVEAHSRITQRNKETVLGKDKTTEINNVNAQHNEEKTINVTYS